MCLVKEHEELTRAIRERNVERAKELSFQHIENQRMAIMRSIEAENAEKEKREREKRRNINKISNPEILREVKDLSFFVKKIRMWKVIRRKRTKREVSKRIKS